ncbi:MAG: hypothetical protein C4557_11430 [Anaerolineaceae bacterium]|nr:MAG: hypothetical protein C4557_11430 [Anaerolineaceae bacterium]
MKTRMQVLWSALTALILFGCAVLQTVPLEGNSLPLATPTFSASNESGGLFADTDHTRNLPSEPHISRARFVTVSLGQLIDEAGEAREVRNITFNLFPDATYTGVIEQVEQAGDTISWSGVLEEVDLSYFTMVYTSGVFMGHFASPLGVYEVVFVEEGLYRVIEIDQTKFPGGEG